MTKKIAVTNKKGGAGKTTSTINFSTELADRGKKVLAIDLDPQSNLTKVLSNGVDIDGKLTTADLFKNYRAHDIRDAIVQTSINENLYFIPAEPHLEVVIESSMAVRNREDILRKLIKNVESEFDFILMDCPPNLGLTTMNALKLGEYFLIPIDAGDFSIDGLAFILEAIEDVKDLEIGTFNEFCVYQSMYDSKNKVMNAFSDKELSAIPDNVLESKIRRATAFSQANVMRLPLKKFQENHPAVKDYESMTNEILGRLGIDG